jgi:sodium/potassium-transporting ATPase subunit alpha
MAEDGSIIPLQQAIQVFETIKNRWSAQGKRVLLLAQRPLGTMHLDPRASPREYEDEVMERAMSGLTVVGIVGIVDPPRAEIPEVIRTLRGAGIKVHMVTGDFKLTAQAIAVECGIITARHVDDVHALESSTLDSLEKQHSDGEPRPTAIVMSGADLEGLDTEQWDALTKYTEIVFARTTPEHKLRIVREFQARVNTVAMTGDGVNDAPSLKAADIGIAMGSGSAVAIEAVCEPTRTLSSDIY